jgi:hypothetical protein
MLDGEAYQVIGVLRAGFQSPEPNILFDRG